MRVVIKVVSLVLLAGILAAAAPAVSAQPNFAGGLYFNAGFPQGEFHDQVDRNAYGIGGEIFFAPSRSPLAIGLDLSWMNYGHESRSEKLSSTIPDITVDVATDNNIVSSFFVLRGHTPGGPIRLYADALIGFNYLFTETKIEGSDENAFRSTNKDDAVFAYGSGGGVMVPVYTRAVGKGKPIQVLLDGGLRYLLGEQAEYLKRGSIERSDDGTISYDVIQSKTNLLRLHVGVMLRF